jgi:hypothetical protein
LSSLCSPRFNWCEHSNAVEKEEHRGFSGNRQPSGLLTHRCRWPRCAGSECESLQLSAGASNRRGGKDFALDNAYRPCRIVENSKLCVQNEAAFSHRSRAAHTLEAISSTSAPFRCLLRFMLLGCRSDRHLRELSLRDTRNRYFCLLRIYRLLAPSSSELSKHLLRRAVALDSSRLSTDPHFWHFLRLGLAQYSFFSSAWAFRLSLVLLFIRIQIRTLVRRFDDLHSGSCLSGYVELCKSTVFDIHFGVACIYRGIPSKLEDPLSTELFTLSRGWGYCVRNHDKSCDSAIPPSASGVLLRAFKRDLNSRSSRGRRGRVRRDSWDDIDLLPGVF